MNLRLCVVGNESTIARLPLHLRERPVPDCQVGLSILEKIESVDNGFFHMCMKSFRNIEIQRTLRHYLSKPRKPETVSKAAHCTPGVQRALGRYLGRWRKYWVDH